MKKYRYFIIAILLVFATPITTHKVNTSLNIVNTKEIEYVDFVEKFLEDIREVQTENPINKGSFKSQGEMYTYNALRERERVLDGYKYNEDMVPSEYKELHLRIVEFITVYREGINIAKEGVLLMRADIIEKGISTIIKANELFVKLQNDFQVMQSH